MPKTDSCYLYTQVFCFEYGQCVDKKCSGAEGEWLFVKRKKDFAKVRTLCSSLIAQKEKRLAYISIVYTGH